MFCQGLEEQDEGHTRKQCPLFKQLKSNTSKRSYIGVDLKEHDSSGYAAAGILPWRRTSDGQIEMLLAREYRPLSEDRAGDKLNFLGGKRLKKETDPLGCAVEKVNQETAGQLSPATVAHMRDGCPLVCWNSDSKYVFFLFELVGENDCEVHIRCAGVAGAKRLEWATRQELMSIQWVQKQMHPFAADMLRQLTSCQIMRHLEELFDTATAPSPKEKSTKQQGQDEGKTPSEAAEQMRRQLSEKGEATEDDNIQAVQDLLARLSTRDD
jgi:hypothetical protein